MNHTVLVADNNMVVKVLNTELTSDARDFYIDDERMIAEICVFAEKYGLLREQRSNDVDSFIDRVFFSTLLEKNVC